MAPEDRSYNPNAKNPTVNGVINAARYCLLGSSQNPVRLSSAFFDLLSYLFCIRFLHESGLNREMSRTLTVTVPAVAMRIVGLAHPKAISRTLCIDRKGVLL